jgi:hypothetical protein
MMKLRSFQMKHLTVLAALVLFSVRGYAQIGIQLYYMDPKDQLEYRLKRTVGLEVMEGFNGGVDKRFSYFTSVGVSFSRPIDDTFLTYTANTETQAITPGWESVKNVISMPIGFVFEYRLLKTRFTPLLGAEMNIAASFVSRDFYNGIAPARHQNKTYWSTGLTSKFGFAYKYSKNWVVSAGISRSSGIGTYANTYFRTFIRGVRYFK